MAGKEIKGSYPMVTIAKRRRGIVGWFFLIVFFVFNAVMALWLVGLWRVSSDAAATTGDRAEVAVSGFIAGTAILWIWLFGAVITGLLALLTRGGKTVVIEK